MYRLTTDQQEIVDQAGGLADETLLPNAAGVDEEARFPEENIEALGEAGFLGLTIPEAYGGMGQGLRVACAVLDQLARRCPSTAMVYFMHLSAIAAYLERPESSEPHLRSAAEGQHLTTLAWSEFGSRSHFWAPVSREQVDGDRVTLDADKSFVTAAGHADGYVVSTGWAEAASPTESMLYLVLDDDGGLTPLGEWDALGMRGNASTPMKLEGVEIPRDRALCDPGAGMQVMLEVVLPVFQLGNAAISLGIAEAACEIARDHVTESRLEHEGSSLADLPNQRARLARMRIETDRARAHLSAVVDAVEEPGPQTQLLVLESKAAAAETAREVTEIAMNTCGGAAYGKALPLERYFRDARAPGIMAPTTDVLHDFIGKALCGMEVM